MTVKQDETSGLITRLQRLRARRAVDRLDELRTLARLASSSMSQSAIAVALGVSQPAVSKRLREAAELAPVREGFSGASAYEIAQRCAAGELSREQVLEELSRWSYEPGDRGDGVDWLSVRLGEFERTVGKAADQGLIDGELYDELVRRLA